MSDLPMIGLRQFREHIDEQTEVVRVVKTRGDITFMGTWIPAAGYEIVDDDMGYVIKRIVRPVSSKKD